MVRPLSIPRLAHRWIRRWIDQVVHTHRSIRLPVEGLVFILVTLFIGVAAIQTAVQLLFLVFAVMCSFWLLSAILATSSLRGLKVSRRTPRITSTHQPVIVQIRVRNNKWVNASYSLRITDYLEGNSLIGAAFFARIRRKHEASSTYECVFPRRGLYRFSHLSVSTRYPFGLIERTVRRSEPEEILVFPATANIGQRLRTAHVDIGDVDVYQKGSGVGLYGIRSYHEGDPARDIHWKVSARSGELMVREYDSDERRRASVILDNRLRADAGEQERREFELAIILANSVASYLVNSDHQVELLTASGKVAFGRGHQHLLRCSRALATLEIEPFEGDAPHPHEPEADSVQIQILYREDERPRIDAIGVGVSEFRPDLEAAYRGDWRRTTTTQVPRDLHETRDFPEAWG